MLEHKKVFVSFSSGSYFTDLKTETLGVIELGPGETILDSYLVSCLISHHEPWLLPSESGTAMNIRVAICSRFCKSMASRMNKISHEFLKRQEVVI